MDRLPYYARLNLLHARFLALLVAAFADVDDVGQYTYRYSSATLFILPHAISADFHERESLAAGLSPRHFTT